MQCLTSIFDDRLERLSALGCQSDAARPMSVFGYRDQENSAQILTLWFDDEVPSDANETTPVSLKVADAAFERPVYVDLRAGTVHRIPEETIVRESGGIQFRRLPIYDSPVLVAEQSLLSLAPA